MSSAAAVSPPPVEYIDVELIDPSPTNPRKTFNEAELKELADSIKSKGLAQFPLVRPHPTEEGRFEIVAGERRWRAHKLAGIEVMPAVVRDLSDTDVLEFQVIENLQRKDLHEIEEADGYQQLLKLNGYSVDTLAEKVGKSKAYIYARLKLCALTSYAREAFQAGVVNASTALLIARIPVPSLQQRAVEEIQRGGALTQAGAMPEPLSVREAAEHIQDFYMLRLGEAIFDPKDAQLLPSAGACSACPKRTGNAKELYGDIKDPNICTDPECFSAKKDAVWSRAVAKAEERGYTVIDDKRSKKLFSPHNPHGVYRLVNDAYIDLDDACELDDKGRHWRAMLGKLVQRTPAERDTEHLHVLLARDPGGNAREIASRNTAEDLVYGKYPDLAKQAQEELSERKRGEADEKRGQERAQLRNAVLKEAVKEMVYTVEMRPPDVKFWRLLLTVLLDTDAVNSELATSEWFFERLGVDPNDDDPCARVAKLAAHMSEGQARAAAFELALFASFSSYSNFVHNDGAPGKGAVLDACKALGVDLKRIESNVKAGTSTSAEGDEGAGDDAAAEESPAKGSKKASKPKAAKKKAAKKSKGKK